MPLASFPLDSLLFGLAELLVVLTLLDDLGNELGSTIDFYFVGHSALQMGHFMCLLEVKGRCQSGRCEGQELLVRLRDADPKLQCV